MYPDIEQVIRKRYLMNLIIRCVIIGLLFWGAFPLIHLSLQYLSEFAILTTSLRSISRFPSFNDVFLGIVPQAGMYIMPGLILLVLRNRLVRWIVPIPKPECPRCGYGLAKLTTPRCPECGQTLPAEMVEDDDSARPA